MYSNIKVEVWRDNFIVVTMIDYVKGLPHSECMLVYNWEFKKIRILSFIIISCDVAFFLKFQQNTTLSYIVLPYNKKFFVQNLVLRSKLQNKPLHGSRL